MRLKNFFICLILCQEEKQYDKMATFFLETKGKVRIFPTVVKK